MDEAGEVPSPGSPLAVARGCLCPIYDNAGGGGHLGSGLFWMTAGCPLHGTPAADVHGMGKDDERE